MIMNMSLRLVTFLLFLTLAVCALLQINDPDPVLWISFYLVCSLVPLLLTCKIYYPALFWFAVALCLITMGIYASGAIEYMHHAAEEMLMQSMNPQKPYIEEAREFLGSLITLGFLLLCQLLRKKILH